MNNTKLLTAMTILLSLRESLDVVSTQIQLKVEKKNIIICTIAEPEITSVFAVSIHKILHLVR